jgi:ribonuclease P protein component
MATFRKHEHLKSARIIGELMEKGKSITVAPVRMVMLETQLHAKVPAQVAFAVPKRNFPRAVDRNRIKRQLRECYRDQKEKLYDFLNSANKQYALMLVFTGKDSLSFNDLKAKFTLTLLRLEKEVKKESEKVSR